jgi:hypothetical protein
LFKLECAEAVTGFARHSLEFAMKTNIEIYEIDQILFCDTDSMAI